MQKLSMRKLSLLGLVLFAASAVTAAITRDKAAKTTANYSLTNSTNVAGDDCDVAEVQQLSCTFSDLTAVGQPCTNTGDSNTTIGGGGIRGTDGSSVVLGVHTAVGGNTLAAQNTSASPC